MQVQFPKSLEKVLLGYLKQNHDPRPQKSPRPSLEFGDRELNFFAKGVKELSQLFTSERRQLKEGYLNQGLLRAGYLLYFFPINFAKNLWVLNQLPPSFWQRDSFRVLDLGAGPGSASFAFFELMRQHRPKAEVELHWVDPHAKALRDGQRILESWKATLNQAPEVKIRTHPTPIPFTPKQGEYDLILMSHVLNEWTQKSALARAEWLDSFLQNHLTTKGWVALLEPALKWPTRELMALRDHLLELGDWQIGGPCLHEKPCPMLAATRNDWCHFYIDWEEAEFLKKLDRLLKNDNRFLKVSYLLFGHGKTEGEKTSQETFRMVSNRMATKGKTEVILCGSTGRVRVTRLNRDRSERNQDMDRVKRGALVSLPQGDFKEYEVDRKVRLAKEDEFRVL